MLVAFLTCSSASSSSSASDSASDVVLEDVELLDDDEFDEVDDELCVLFVLDVWLVCGFAGEALSYAGEAFS